MSPERSKGGFMADIRNQKWSVPVGLAITALVSIFLLLFTTQWLCFAPILIALCMYFLPVFFGLKDKKKIAVFGIVLIIAMSLIYGAFMASSLSNMSQPNMKSANDVLTNGTVTPIVSNPGTALNFTVQLNGGNETSVVCLYMVQWPLGGTLYNYSMNNAGLVPGGGNSYYYELTLTNLSAGIYEFAYWTSATGKQVFSIASWGPIYADSTQILATSLYGGFLQVFLFTFIAPLFFVFLAMMWWMDRSRIKMEDKQRKAQPPQQKPASTQKEKFVCSECGTDVPADATECPQCGEKFDDGEKKEEAAKKASAEMHCPKCNNIIFETDKKCWNCGMDLEKK
jgi:hypothetical protein